jgi:hypothetical protein
MNGKDIKALRGQIRIAVKEMLPEIITEELYKLVEHKVALRVEGIERFVKEKMTEMTESHKNTMSFLIREASLPTKTE